MFSVPSLSFLRSSSTMEGQNKKKDGRGRAKDSGRKSFIFYNLKFPLFCFSNFPVSSQQAGSGESERGIQLFSANQKAPILISCGMNKKNLYWCEKTERKEKERREKERNNCSLNYATLFFFSFPLFPLPSFLFHEL